MDKKEKLIQVFVNRGMSREQAEKEVEFRLKKAELVRKVLNSGTEFEVEVLGGSVSDKYFEVLQEINRSIRELGIEETEERGWIRTGEDGTIKYIDYRQSVRDKPNPFYNTFIEEIPDNKRYLGSYYGIMSIDGKDEIVKIFYPSKKELPQNKIKIFGNMNKDDRGITIFADGDYQIIGDVNKDKVKEVLENKAIGVKDVKDRYEKWISDRQGVSYTIIKGFVIDIIPNNNYAGGNIVISDYETSDVITLTYNRDELPDLGDNVIALTFLYEREKEEEKVLIAKAYYLLVEGSNEGKIEEEDIDKILPQEEFL